MSSTATGDVPRTPDGVTAEGEALPSQRLRYLASEVPEPGASVALGAGVRWARIPLPVDLDHINVWLIEDAGGSIIVDTGMAAGIGKDAWARIEQDVLVSQPVRAIFVTHVHPDHLGLAAWLQDRFGAPVMMSERTREFALYFLAADAKPETENAAAFFRMHGLPDFSSLQPMFRPDRFATILSGMPRVDREVRDGEVLRFGSNEWLAMETNGHAEGHLCLWNSAARVLISGDQVLPTISSNISYTWRSGDPDPLGSYLSSLARLRELPEDTLVLPSHGRPFRGLHQRIDELRDHHHEQLDKLVKASGEPKTAAELLPVMFRRALKGMHLFLAFAEALAHLEHLVHSGRAERIAGEVTRYRALPP